MMRMILTSIFVLILATEAFAYCFEPNAPSPPGSWKKPNKPFCLTDYEITGRNTCDQWELDSYISDVNEYIDDLRDYARDAQKFANDAVNYAQCEANETTDGF